MNEFVVTFNSRKKNVKLSGNNSIWVEDKEYNQELYQLSGDTYLLKLDNKIYEISVVKLDNDKFNISVDGKNYETIVRSLVQEKAVKLIELKTSAKNKLEVKAPMPGMVLKINKKAGDEVEEGESVLILEAMKMENDLRAHISGKIKNIYIKEGMTVEKGYILFAIEQ